MVIIVLIAGMLLLLVTFALRNAVALTLVVAGACAVWTVTHDLPATCVAATAGLFLSAFALELGAVSSSRVIRVATIGAEVAVAMIAAATLAFMLFHDGQSAEALSITTLAAVILGGGIALGGRARQR